MNYTIHKSLCLFLVEVILLRLFKAVVKGNIGQNPCFRALLLVDVLQYRELSIWSNYSDLTRPISPKWWFSKGNGTPYFRETVDEMLVRLLMVQKSGDHHLECINLVRFVSHGINYLSTGAGFQPSAVFTKIGLQIPLENGEVDLAGRGDWGVCDLLYTVCN